MPIIRKSDVTPETGAPYPAPFDKGMDGATWWALSDVGGLSQFGAFVETLAAGKYSSHRHWHEQEDEFLYLLSGELTVIEDDGPNIMNVGDAATWKAGVSNGHHLFNHTDKPATYLMVGTRAQNDRAHYPDDDLLYTRQDGQRGFTRKDGSALTLEGNTE